MLTFQNLKEQFLSNINLVGSTNAALLADFKRNLGARYQLCLAALGNYKTEQEKTASTVASQQYYSYPQGVIRISACKITVGSYAYDLEVIHNQQTWNNINAVAFQGTVLPQFIFPRKTDFGIWPIPSAAYTITFNYYSRDKNLTIDDYTAGTINVTNDSTAVVGVSTTFTSAMVGRYLEVTSESSDGQGYFYLISAVADTTHLTLSTPFEGTDASAVTFRIGQVPDLPDEGHIILCDGATADYYSGLQKDITAATWFNNKFWTGDGNNPSRQISDKNVQGGLIGLQKRYSERENQHVIKRNAPAHDPFLDRAWGYSITP